MEIIWELLTSRAILVNNRLCYPVEIELYLHRRDHPDPYVHCHDEQKTNGYWYFHRASSNSKDGKYSKYRGGTFKGLDLTLGDETSYCSILIRSMLVPAGDGNFKLIEGPCLCVNYILQCYDVDTIEELTNNLTMSVVDNHRNLLLVGVPPRPIHLRSGPRVGLSDKSDTPERYHYRQLGYRWVSYDGIKRNKRTLS